jgi:hypothetical protein
MGCGDQWRGAPWVGVGGMPCGVKLGHLAHLQRCAKLWLVQHVECLRAVRFWVIDEKP